MAIAQSCEEILISAGGQKQAYSRFALATNEGGTNLATFRAIEKTYPPKDPRGSLDDLIAGNTMVVERQGAGGDDQNLLRVVTKTPDGRYVLKATNPDYPDYAADAGMRTLARLKAVLGEDEIGFA
jgi:hypothetical protein